MTIAKSNTTPSRPPRVTQAMVRTLPPMKSYAMQLLLAPFAIVIAIPMYLFMLNEERSLSWIAKLLPNVMKSLDKAFKKVKTELTSEIAGGRVLDVGAGGGGWLNYLGEADEIVELEPNANLNSALRASIAAFLAGSNNSKPRTKKVEIVNKFVSDLPPHELFDYVILGNVLCEVPDQLAVLREVEARLKPGGRVIFLEHVLDEGFIGVFQRTFNWWWCVASAGCNCNRRSLRSIQRVFGAENVESYKLWIRAPLPFLHSFVAGVATKVSGVSDAGNNNNVPSKM